MYDMIIVGAGTAGLTAGIYALRSGVKPLILECEAMGGQITLSPCVENYPGIAKISGMEFADGLMAQLTNLGGEVTYGNVISTRKIDNSFEVCTEDGETYEGKNLIIASGAAHRHLGIEREQELIGRGISYCAVCDGPFFKEKTAAVVGGGSAALQDALYLANLCEKVYLIHRREGLRAAKELSEKVMAAENIEFLPYYEVKEIAGDGMVQKVILTQNQTGEEKEIELSGIFIAVGMEPQTAFVKDVVERNDAGYICAGEDCRTNVPGIYVAGDVRTKPLRQVITAVSDGAVAIASLEQDRN